MATTVILGNHYWGTGPDVTTAKARFRREGGRLSNGYMILTFDDETEFMGVDNFGRYSWKGNAPTEQWVKPVGDPSERKPVRKS